MRSLERIAAAFVEPVTRAGPPAWAPPAAQAGALVLCRPRDAPALGSALALALLSRAGARAAVVAEWGVERVSVGSGWATPAARAVAADVAGRGLPARAAGRLVRASLPPADAEGAAAVRSLLGLAPAPLVVVLAAPRAEAMDRATAALAPVVVCEPDDALAEIAVAELAASGRGAVRLPAARRSLAGVAARAGLALRGPLRERALSALAR